MTCEWSAPACRWSSSWLLICLGIQCQQSWIFFNNSQQHLKYTCHCLLLIHIQGFHCISIISLVTWHFFCYRCHSHTDKLTQTQSGISLLLLTIVFKSISYELGLDLSYSAFVNKDTSSPLWNMHALYHHHKVISDHTFQRLCISLIYSHITVYTPLYMHCCIHIHHCAYHFNTSL